MGKRNLEDLATGKVLILEAVAEAWNRVGINYVVAHGLEGYQSNRIGRDLDIVIPERQVVVALSVAGEVLANVGYTVINPPSIWGNRLVALFCNDRSDEYIEVHTMTGLSWGVATIVDRPLPSLVIGPFKIDPWTSFVKRILLPVLAESIDKFWERPEELRVDLAEQEPVGKMLPRFVGEKTSDALLHMIRARDLKGISRLRNRLRWSLTIRAAVRNPFIAVSKAWQKGWTRVLQYVSPCGPIVALVGLDGAGKSSAIECLCQKPPTAFSHMKVLVKHWRPNLLPPLCVFVGRAVPVRGQAVAPRRTPGRFHWLRLLYYFADFFVGSRIRDVYASSRQQLILYDRCGLDMAVDPVRYGLSSARGISLFWRLIPKPDLVVLLYDDPERIHARKPELPKKEIKRQIKEWLRLAERGSVDAILEVDAPPEEIAERVKGLIVEAFIHKNGGPVSQKDDCVVWLNTVLTKGTQSAFINRGDLPASGESHSRYEYGLISLKQGRELLIPLDSSKAALQGLELYNAQTSRARLAKRLLTMGLRLGVAQPFLRKFYLIVPRNGSQGVALGGSLLEHLKQVLGKQDLRIAISFGTPGPHRKPMLQALASNGTLIGYVKVGWNEVTNNLVKNEARTLRCLADVSFRSFSAPGLLQEGSWEGRYFCVQSPPRAKAEAAPRILTAEYFAALRDLAALHTRWMPLRESAFWVDFLQQIKSVQNAYYRHVLQQGAERVEERLGEKLLPFHVCHGDFAPWNAKRVDGNLFLFDWEYSSWEAPPGYDLLHFAVQTAKLLQRSSPGGIVKAFRDGGVGHKWLAEFLKGFSLKNHLSSPQNPIPKTDHLLLLYLLDRLAFYASQRDADSETLRYFANLVTLSVLDEETKSWIGT